MAWIIMLGTLVTGWCGIVYGVQVMGGLLWSDWRHVTTGLRHLLILAMLWINMALAYAILVTLFP
jgi:hypothetical protein